MRSSEATASPAMSPFLAVRVSTERSQHVCGSASPRSPLAARSSTVTGITNRPARSSVGATRLVLVTLGRRSPSGRASCTYPLALNSSQAGAWVSGISATIRGGPRIESLEPSEASRCRP